MLIAGNDIPTEREHAAISKQGCNFSLRSLSALEYGMDYRLEDRGSDPQVTRERRG